MLNRHLIATLLSLCCLFMTAQVFAKETLVKEKRMIPPFTSLYVYGTGHLYIKQGKKESLIIESTPAVLAKISSEVQAEFLTLGPKENTHFEDVPLNYYLTVNNIEEIKTAGDIMLSSQGKLIGDELMLTTEGSTHALLKVKFNTFKTKISGSGRIVTEGTAKDQMIEIEGSGKYEGKKLTSNVTNITINGSGEAILHASEELNINIAGSGTVKYYGAPKINQQVSGSGEIIPL